MFATVKRSRGVDGVGGYDTNVDVSPSLQHKSKQLKTDKEYEFIRHIRDLNKSLQTFFKKQISNNAIADLSLAAQDYLDYAKQLEERYLSRHGEVLTFGSGDCGQLAHGVDSDEDMMVRYPRVVDGLRGEKVCAISCGGLHNAVCTENGEVYTWGCSDDGSLGRQGDENVPILVDALRNEVVISVACGDGQTIALTAHGEVWGWGCYKDKEGKKFFNPCSTAANPVKDIKKQQNEPIKISGLPHIVEIACGSSFCLALCSTGHVYSWGLGECGELGRRVGPLKVKGLDADGEEDMVYDLPAILNQHLTPQLMCVSSSGGRDGSDRGTPIENVKTIGCGSYHSLVVTIGAKAYSCGLNNYGQLGLTAEVGKSSAGVNEDTESRPLLQAMLFFRDVPLLAVSGGVHHSLVLTADNRLFTFGRGDSGQLGTPQMEGKSAGAFSSQPLPVLLPSSVDKFAKVVSFSCGGNHNLVLLSNKDVYSWGYGDMLALGHGDERDENTPRRLNFSKSKIGNISVSKVAGGGQHSALIGEVLSTK